MPCKYLYLTRPEWAETWVSGGQVPIALASTYRSVDRAGTMTPDENLIHDAPVDIASLRHFGFHFEKVKCLTFTGNTFNRQLLPSFENANYYTEDGLILSFSNVLSFDICARLGKAACVEILDVDALKAAIDDQLGVAGTAKNCTYTADHRRDHFLKSVHDEWQHEFRIFWPLRAGRNVILPPGMARHIAV